jgi:selenocysteine lyase/cysteine desulfurase
VPGTNIVTTVLEHPSAFDAAAYAAGKTGMELRVARADPATGRIEADEIVRLVDGDTCFLSVMYASNITGSVMDIGAAVRGAREKKPGLYCICDAVQHAMHGVMDMDALGLDALVFAPYKFFSTRGAGYAALSPRMSLLRHHKLAGKPAGVWELGSPTPSNFAAVSAVVDYVCSMGDEPETSERRIRFVSGMKAIREHETALYERMMDGTGAQKGLRGIPGVRVFCDDRDLSRKDLIIAFAVEGVGCAELVSRYAAERITVYERVRTSIYSARMLEALGIDGCVRVSPLHCNTEAEVGRFLAVTEKLAKDAAAGASSGRDR